MPKLWQESILIEQLQSSDKEWFLSLGKEYLYKMIKEIKIFRTNRVLNDISPLSNLNELIMIIIQRKGNITSLKPIENLIHLPQYY
jgi:hypothetical protein